MNAKSDFSLDIDSNGSVDPITDGILILRHLWGLADDDLIAGALGDGANRTDPNEISQFLEDNLELLDVDLNGVAEFSTDAILIFRDLIGLAGYALTDGAIGAGAERTTPEEIADYIENLYSSIPLADDDFYTLAEDRVITIAAPGVLKGDSDPGEDLSVSVVNAEEGNVGSQITLDSGALLTLNKNGKFIYNPNGVFEQEIGDEETATDSFTYSISDSFGVTDTATVTLTITGITGEGEANAFDDAYTTSEDILLSVSPQALLDNDEDPDTLTITQINGVDYELGTNFTLSSGAILTLSEDNGFTYDSDVPNYQFEGLDIGEIGIDTFTYTVSNGEDTDVASVAITIDTIGEEDDLEQRISITPLVPKSAIGGGAVSFDVVYNTSNDNANLTGLGLQLFFNSSLLAFEEDTVLENVFAKDLISQQILEDTNNLDSDLDTDRIIAVNWADTDTNTPSDWTGNLPQVLYTVNFTTAENFEPSTVNFRTTKTALGYILDAPSVTVEVNEAPNAFNDRLDLNSNATGEGNLLENDTDPDNPESGQTLTITQINGTDVVFDRTITLDSGALLIVSADGSYAYNPNDGVFRDMGGFENIDSFTYSISDRLGGTDTATVNIIVGDNTITLPPSFFTLDIDVEGTADALTDGILILRHLFGFTGSSLTNGALGNGAFLSDAGIIAGKLEGNREELDVDDNGATDALSDGILVLRNMFGFSGDAAIAGALGNDALRNTADAVASYIDSLFPG